MSDTFLVPTVDIYSLTCETVAVVAPSEAAAVWAVLRSAANLRFTGGQVERVELKPEFDVVRDVWADRWRPARQKENAR